MSEVNYRAIYNTIEAYGRFISLVYWLFTLVRCRLSQNYHTGNPLDVIPVHEIVESLKAKFDRLMTNRKAGMIVRHAFPSCGRKRVKDEYCYTGIKRLKLDEDRDNDEEDTADCEEDTASEDVHIQSPAAEG